MTPARSRLVVAITGASGAIYGIRLLQQLRAAGTCEVHLVLSPAGLLTATQEVAMGRTEIEALADVVHNNKDIGASIASGSFGMDGMVIAPCSMKTLAAVAHGFADNLITRAADVVLKERRRLVLLTREAPLNLAHLRNMVSVTEMGGIIFPPVPAFYAQPQTLDEVVDHTVGRVLDLFSIQGASPIRRWTGTSSRRAEEGPAETD
jgi:polyprenyl P-hydroxybenzoate/phenylacrylic acid decarboxylase-like protein